GRGRGPERAVLGDGAVVIHRERVDDHVADVLAITVPSSRRRHLDRQRGRVIEQCRDLSAPRLPAHASTSLSVARGTSPSPGEDSARFARSASSPARLSPRLIMRLRPEPTPGGGASVALLSWKDEAVRGEWGAEPRARGSAGAGWRDAGRLSAPSPVTATPRCRVD